MACNSCTSVYILFIPIIYFILKYLLKKWKAINMEKMLERWSHTPKDLVILHGTFRGKTCPSPSPFILKVETYLRMCGIKYEYDHKDAWGPKGRFPWISVNSEHVADSTLLMDFISKKFKKDLSQNVDKRTLAIATLSRLMLEEHAFWGLVLERFVYRPHIYVSKFMNFKIEFLAKRYLKKTFSSRSRAQGLGLHTEQEVVHLVTKDLRTLSTILGTQKYICGDEPTEEDCAIFGFLAQIIWTLPHSVYDKLIKEELKNLQDYCHRIKEKYFPDWDEIIQK